MTLTRPYHLAKLYLLKFLLYIIFFNFYRYDFKLTTIMAVSGDSAYPVAHMLSKAETEKELNTLFETVIKWNTPCPKFIMSDGAKNYATRFSKYFPQAQHKLCIWHVYRAWATKLKKEDPKKFKQQFGRLVSIQRELNTGRFVKRLDDFLKNSSQNFRTYFEPYLNEIEKWAAYARRNIGINVNMYLESFHRILKRDFLVGNLDYGLKIQILASLYVYERLFQNNFSPKAFKMHLKLF